MSTVPPDDRPAEAGSPRRTAMLSELAAELRAARAEQRRDVEQLRARFEPELTRLGELLGENADLLAQMIPRVGSLDSEVADLGARVDALTTRTTPAPATDWPSLPSAAAATEWDALAGWIDEVLGPFYGITRGQLPDCWALHPRAVIELVWLHHCYLAAYVQSAPATAAADWHTRWLPAALNNIRAAIPERTCAPGRHATSEDDAFRHAPPPQAPPPPMGTPTNQRAQPTCRAAWGSFYAAGVDEDLAHRRAREQILATPPTPPPRAPATFQHPAAAAAAAATRGPAAT